MRQSKIGSPFKSVEQLHSALFQRVHDRNRETLLMLLNRQDGRHMITGFPFTPETRRRMTEFVTATKRTLSALALMDPITVEAPLNSTIERCREEIADLNQVLSQVRLVPEVTLSPNGRSLSVFEQSYFDPEVRLETLEKHGWKATGSNLTLLEHLAVLGVINLLREGAIDSLRRCEECGTWFYATRADQKFCTSTCRQRNHAAKPDFNNKRRDWYRTKKKIEGNRKKALDGKTAK
jgi:hypothetical protein